MTIPPVTYCQGARLLPPKARRKKRHEETYGRPMCHLCKECYFDKSKKNPGYTYYCSITGADVGASRAGWASPRTCPKRKEERK